MREGVASTRTGEINSSRAGRQPGPWGVACASSLMTPHPLDAERDHEISGLKRTKQHSEPS